MEFDEFLKEIAPLFGLYWRPFQRRGVKRKIERRIVEVGFSNFEDYLLRVQKDPEEQSYLSKTLTVTISRFFRDREVFDLLEHSIIPMIIKKKRRMYLKSGRLVVPVVKNLIAFYYYGRKNLKKIFLKSIQPS